MDMILDKILNVGGPLGVLVCVVWIFVKAFQTANEEHRTWMKGLMDNNQAWVERMHLDHINARAETRICLEKNTVAMIENTKSNGELNFSIRQLTKTQ